MEPLFKDEWTDIVFESRNKAYGAYQLRHSYHKHMMVAFLICMAPLGSLLALSSFNTEQNQKGTIYSPMLPLDKKVVEELIKKPKSPSAPKGEKTGGKHVVVKTDTLISKPENKEELGKNTSNTSSQDTSSSSVGSEAGGQNSDIGSGTDTTSGTVISPKPAMIDKDAIVLVPDEKAVFNENVQQYFAKHFNYPREAILNNIQGKIRVRFVIETDGSVSNIRFLSKALGFGIEEEVTLVIASMPAWKPAISKGQKVRSQFTMPMEIRLQE